LRFGFLDRFTGRLGATIVLLELGDGVLGALMSRLRPTRLLSLRLCQLLGCSFLRLDRRLILSCLELLGSLSLLLPSFLLPCLFLLALFTLLTLLALLL
jgi:hypothetical protein